MVYKTLELLLIVLLHSCILLCYGAFEDIETRLEQFAHIKSKASPSVQEQAVSDLIARLLPAYKDNFHIKVDEKLNGKSSLDKFAYVSVGPKLSIRCTSGVACALGFNHFLKYFCMAHISWSGDQLNIPKPFPTVEEVMSITVPNRFRYYQNVCTSSYSFAWWNWTRWQREIDWMAMNGINLPLAFTGQEAMWQKVYLHMGLTQKELDSHFGGPAFLAWSRMGNMHGWGGPLPSTWYNMQLALQHKILTAMRNLGMTPVLPGFAGHVPKGLTRLYPKANVSKLGDWGHFDTTYCCTYLLDPTDPLFKQIGGAFIKAQISEFGTNHIYNADTFNEMEPRSSDPAYLSAASKAVYDGMLAGDPGAIWLMQGWLFLDGGFWMPPQIKALLQGVPQGKMIVLDLMAETTPMWKRTNSFYGQPFIWCMLNNFGGNLGLYGNIESIASNPVLARYGPNSTMVGTGITPEGINQNDMIYDFMNEMGTVINETLAPQFAQNWVWSYSLRRYGGGKLNTTAKAWQLLLWSVYNCTDGKNNLRRTVITAVPSFTIVPHVWFNVNDVYQAWDALLSAADEFGKVETFRYDLVDVTREVLHLLSINIYHDIVTAYRNKQLTPLKASSKKLLDLMTDLDNILLTNQHFLLGHWLESAKALGTTPNEVKLYEYNARNQITLWGPRGEINDYANKMWNGMVGAYYKPRWQLFTQELVEAVSKGKEIDYNAFKAKLLIQETAWTKGTEKYSTVPKGDSVELAKSLHKKYRPNNIHL